MLMLIFSSNNSPSISGEVTLGKHNEQKKRANTWQFYYRKDGNFDKKYQDKIEHAFTMAIFINLFRVISRTWQIYFYKSWLF